MKKLFFASICFLMTACSTQQKKQEPDINQLNQKLEENRIASIRDFPGKSKIEVLSAAQTVLRLLDKPDMKFDVADDELMATRFSTYYAVFSFGFGRDWYSFKVFEDSKNNVFGRFSLYGEMLDGLPPPIPESFKSQIPISAHTNPADLTLFNDRVEYVLGLRKIWPECPPASGRKRMMLCDNIGIEDMRPN